MLFWTPLTFIFRIKRKRKRRKKKEYKEILKQLLNEMFHNWKFYTIWIWIWIKELLKLNSINCWEISLKTTKDLQKFMLWNELEPILFIFIEFTIVKHSNTDIQIIDFIFLHLQFCIYLLVMREVRMSLRGMHCVWNLKILMFDSLIP